jgi:hypothetical protein
MIRGKPMLVPTGATITAILLVVALAAVAVYDAYAGLFLGGDATVTSVVQAWSRDYPLIPFLAGLLAGHLFWR